jgi:hypothetical protein
MKRRVYYNFRFFVQGIYTSKGLLRNTNYVRINLLKPTGKFTYHQVLHSRILRGVHIAFMCSVWTSDQTATFTLHIINWLVFITEVGGVYSAVRAGSSKKTDLPFVFKWLKYKYCHTFVLIKVCVVTWNFSELSCEACIYYRGNPEVETLQTLMSVTSRNSFIALRKKPICLAAGYVWHRSSYTLFCTSNWLQLPNREPTYNGTFSTSTPR